MLWKKKSQIDWIKEGNKNSKFFHLSTLIRRRQNRIESLLNTDDIWVKDKEELKGLTVSFYKNLFSAEQASGGVAFVMGKFLPINNDQSNGLEMKFSSDEVWRALKGMGPQKSPGPYGFPPAFF